MGSIFRDENGKFQSERLFYNNKLVSSFDFKKDTYSFPSIYKFINHGAKVERETKSIIFFVTEGNGWEGEVVYEEEATDEMNGEERLSKRGIFLI